MATVDKAAVADAALWDVVTWLESKNMHDTVKELMAEWETKKAAAAAAPAAVAATGVPSTGQDSHAPHDVGANGHAAAPLAPSATEHTSVAAPIRPPAAISSPPPPADAPFAPSPDDDIEEHLSETEQPEVDRDEAGAAFQSLTGVAVHLWDLADFEEAHAPTFPHGGGVTLEEFQHAVREAVTMVSVVPYKKPPPLTGLPLESFDLRVIYEAGKTGFEEAKEFPITTGTIIAGRYQIVDFLGAAAFSRAVQCIDLKHQVPVCVKVIRNGKDMIDQSLDEIKLLQLLNANCDPDEKHVLQLFDYFYYKEHMFLVCELLRDNLYEFAKFNREREEEFYFTLPRVQSIAKQVLTALDYVHSLGLLHCDLKPENILVKSYSRCEVKVIDFGNSCFTTDNLSSYVQSRCYRAPEVILGCEYDGRIDIWSLGTMLPELITGHVLFSNSSIPQMLARICAILGPFPTEMLHNGRHTGHFITKHGAIYERVKDDDGDEERLVFHFPIRCSLEQVCGTTDADFIDFVRQCLVLDHKKRPTAAQLLSHPFLHKTF